MISLDKEMFLKNIRKIIEAILYPQKMNCEISFNTKLVGGIGENELDLSSIDYVDFLVRIEEEYDIVYEFDVKIYTIEDLYNYIKNCKKGNENIYG